MAVPIMNELGMGLGILLWSVTNSIVSWATGNFGLFGTTARPAASSWMNYGGLVLTLIGGALISFVKIKPAPIVSGTEPRKVSFFSKCIASKNVSYYTHTDLALFRRVHEEV